MNRLRIDTKSQLRIFNNPINLVLFPKDYRVSGVQDTLKDGKLQIEPFFVDRPEDDFLEIGFGAFLREDVLSATVVIERVYECIKYNIQALVKEREFNVVFSERENSEEDDYSENNPHGGTLEVYDIERESKLCD